MTTRAEMAEHRARSVYFSRTEWASIAKWLHLYGTKQSVKVADRIDNHLAYLREKDVIDRAALAEANAVWAARNE